MDQLENCGLVKFDLLGLKTLDNIKSAEELIRKRGEQHAGFAINTIPLDDRPTFDMMSRGYTQGVFQFETEGMQEILRQAKPDSINDLIILNTIYRPGLLDNIPTLIARKAWQ
jgi:DNA polymerase-3 subunit alpha